MDYISEIVYRIQEIVDIEESIIRNTIDVSKENELWKYSIACFKFNKSINMKPNILARYLYENFRGNIFNVEIVNDIYLNFFIKKSLLGEKTIEKILFKKEKHIKSSENTSNKICINNFIRDSNDKAIIDNIASIVIGECLKNIFMKCKYKVDFIACIDDYKITDKAKIFKEINNYHSIFNDKFTHIERKSEYIDKEGIEKSEDISNAFRIINGLEVLSLEMYNMAPYPIYNINKRIDLNMIYNINNRYNYNKYIEIIASNKITMVEQRFKALEIIDSKLKNHLHIVTYEAPKFQYENILQNYINNLNVDMFIKNRRGAREKEIVNNIKYIFIKNINKKNIYLDYKDILGHEKGTLKYITNIRKEIEDILRYNRYSIDNINFEYLEDAKYPLLDLLQQYEKVLAGISETLNINELNIYLLKIINNFNKFYGNDSFNTIKKVDLVLIEAIGIIIDDLLEIMGIE